MNPKATHGHVDSRATTIAKIRWKRGRAKEINELIKDGNKIYVQAWSCNGNAKGYWAELEADISSMSVAILCTSMASSVCWKARQTLQMLLT
jgi:hypothetical protein